MENLIEQYIDLATKHGQFTLEGDSANGNKVHSKMMKTIEQIKLQSQNIRYKFFATLRHENDSVKMWTATTLLKTKETESMEVLKQIAETNKSIHGLTAATTLDCWRKGILTDITNWNE
jgi:hypothetical protein